MTNCIVSSCERPYRSKSLGYCDMHYRRWKRSGKVTIVPRPKIGSPCIGPGCPNASVARGYCGLHLQRLYRGVPLNEARSLPERFMSFVEIHDEGCWLWIGTTLHSGYGQFRVFGQKLLAHRVAFVGAISAHGCVCHRCDVRNCVRPEHLFLGTISDNQLDRRIKARARLATQGERA